MNIKSSQDLVEEANKSIQTLDPTTGQDLTESTAKLMVGWGLVGYFMYGENGAYDRIDSGLPSQGKQLPDGTIREQTFDWPLSTFNTVANIMARENSTANVK